MPLLVVVLGIEVAARAGSLDTYEQLLPSVLERSADPLIDVPLDTAITHGLALEAALAAGDQETADRVRGLLLDDELPGGWGMGPTWDPYADGSPTIAGTPFATTTAIAVDALLESGLTPAEAERIGDALVGWNRSAWTDGYFWYSLAVQDNVDTPSASALLAGATARFLGAHGDTLEPFEVTLLRNRVEDTFEHLGETHDAQLRWIYSARHTIVNDLASHVLVLWGAERARDAGFTIPWSRAEAVASIGAYGSVYPPDIEQTPSMLGRRGSQWQTAGTGIALAFAVTWGGDARRWANATCETLEITPRAPRFDAHALLGMALSGLCDCPNRRLPRALPISSC